MTRQSLWSEIADTLAGEITRGAYGPGDRLPSEADLARRFGVNRHTVRRALARLAGEGTLHARRGAGGLCRGPPGNRIPHRAAGALFAGGYGGGPDRLAPVQPH